MSKICMCSDLCTATVGRAFPENNVIAIKQDSNDNVSALVTKFNLRVGVQGHVTVASESGTM